MFEESKCNKEYSEDWQNDIKGISRIERVVNWQHRIAKYSPEIQNIYRILFKRTDDFFKVLAEPSKDWKVTINFPSKNLLTE